MTLRQSATNNLLAAYFLVLSATGTKASMTTLGAAARGWTSHIDNAPCNLYGGGVAETNGSDAGNNRYGSANFTYTIFGLTTQPLHFTDINNNLVVLRTATTTPGSFRQTVTVVLDAAGLAAIRAAQGLATCIGGIDSGEIPGGSKGDFSFTGNYDAGFSVPLPGTLVANITAQMNANFTRAVPPVGFTPGGPPPAPATYDLQGSRFAYIIVKVSEGCTSCMPPPNALLSGVIADGANSSDFYASGKLNLLKVNAVRAGAPTINAKLPTPALDGSGSTGGT